jgi:hypothetical protein
MASSKDTTMKPATRLEIDLRNRNMRTRSSGTEDRHPLQTTETAPGPHTEREGEKPDSARPSHTGPALALNSKPTTDTLQAPKRASSEATRRGGVETGVNGRAQGPSTRAGAESDNGRPQHSRTRSRRVLLSDYSEDEELEEADPHNKQLLLKQSKPPPSHDYDIDMQLADVLPEHGGSSLRLSMSNEEFVAAPNQTAISRLDVINLDAMTPTTTTHKSPRIEATNDNHSAKRRRSDAGRLKTYSDSTKSHNMKTKEAIPSIDIVAQMWLGFPIHEAVAT